MSDAGKGQHRGVVEDGSRVSSSTGKAPVSVKIGEDDQGKQCQPFLVSFLS
jgi:hypothetical protein